jgi:hypothetical protein
MTKTSAPALSPRQTTSLMRALALMAVTPGGTVSLYDMIGGRVHQGDRQALVAKGVLSVEYRDFVMPTGPYAGVTYTDYPFYFVGE